MASRRTRQQGSSSSGAGSQADGVGRETQIVQQYSAGKKFRVKYLGSHDIDDYRNKRETSAIMADLKRRSSKATKPKAVVTIFSKELVVLDEKSKTVTMKVPVQKVKFICHDKQDSSLFGVILATDRITSESQRLHRLFCYQADQKTAVSFVRSINELFQALGTIMRERRRNAENGSSSNGAGGGGGAGGVASSSGGGASSASGQTGRRQSEQSETAAPPKPTGTGGGDPLSDEEERYEPIPLGFGIPPPPPSYKAAISKKNEAIFRKPDDVETTVNTRLPPPPAAARPKKLAAPLPSSGTSASPTAPPIAPPPTARPRRTVQERPVAATPTSQAVSAAPTSVTTPTSVATPTSATSLPLPQVPEEVGSSRTDGVATFSVGGNRDEDSNGFNPNFDGNIYDVPTNNSAALPNQGQREVVWQEWQALESELQTIAQDLGFDMDNGSIEFSGTSLPPVGEMRIPSPIVPPEGGVEASQSFSSNAGEDPFADDFFQTSFGSSSASISMQAAWPESVSSMAQIEDPFGGSGSGFEATWGTRMDSISESVGDPFQEGVVTSSLPSSSAATLTSDPFQDSAATPTSAAVSFDFSGFSSQPPLSEAAASMTPSSAQGATEGFEDEGFGSNWGAFGDGVSSSATPTSVAATLSQSLGEQNPLSSTSPPLTTIPKQVDSAQVAPPPSRNGFQPDQGSRTAVGVTPTPGLPPPLPKRDSVGLIPPPVSPQRRADVMTDRNQSTTTTPRSRPHPSVDPAPNAAGQVILNRPAKSRSSPNQSRVSSGEVEVQIPAIPPTEFDSSIAGFEASFPSFETTENSAELATAVVSDPFQESPSLAVSGSSQVTVGDPFLQDVPPSLPTSADKARVDVEAQHGSVNPFLDDFLPAVSGPNTSTADSGPFQAGFAQSASPTGENDDPFQNSATSFSAEQQVGSNQNAPFDFGGSGVSTSTHNEATGTAWSAFGDGGAKQHETSGSDWSPFGDTAPSGNQPASQEPAAWSDFDSKPQQQQLPAASSFSGFGDDWSSFSGDGGTGTATSVQRQPTGTNATQKTKTSISAVDAVPATASQSKSESSWKAFGGRGTTSSSPSVQAQPQQSARAGLIPAPPPAKSSHSSGSPVSSRTRPRGRPSTTDSSLGGKEGLSFVSSSQRTQDSQPSPDVAKSQPQTTSNPLNKAEVKKSSSYLEELSSIGTQPQFPPLAMNYQAGGGASFPQQPPGGWGGQPGHQPSPFSQPQQPPPASYPYGQGMPSQQQQQFMQQQQQAMFMQQQQMQQGPAQMHMQQGPGQMHMQQGPGKMHMQQGPGTMQQGPWQMQAQQGNYQMQQGLAGQQFSPGGPQMMGPPGAGHQMQPQFSTPQPQQQNFYQRQFQQNANAFSPVQHQNPLTPGNASMGSVDGSANLSTSNLYTSDFSSPPYAVGSSTPQSGTASSPSPPSPTVEYRPAVNDGRPDPFAALVTGALTPSKDTKVRAIDAEKLKAAFVKSPPPQPNQGYPTTASPYGNAPHMMNPQGGWS